MMKQGKMHTVVFDIGNVLVKFDWKMCLDALKYEEEMQNKLKKVFCSEVWLEGDRGNVTKDTWLPLFLDLAPELEKEIRNVYENLNLVIRKYPFADAMIQTFRDAGFGVYFLSNYSEYLYEKSKTDLDFIESMDGGVFSYREKCIKPQEEIYNRLLTRYNINPYEAWFFDDRLENVEAARKAGLNAVQFDCKVADEILAGNYIQGDGK